MTATSGRGRETGPGSCRPRLYGDTAAASGAGRVAVAARSSATSTSRALIESAGTNAGENLGGELKRLEDLASRNSRISPAEITSLRKLRDEALTAIDFPRLRLDALRLVWCG